MEALRKLLATRAVRRGALLIGALAVLAIVIAGIDLQPNLARVKVAILSGSEGGNYHAIVARLSAEVRSGRGQIENLATQGSIDNIERLSAARRTCHAQFALVQDGLEWSPGLELVARLPRSESVFFLGRNADRIRALTDLRGFQIGIGPEGSGTARLARGLLEGRDLASLGLKLTHHPLDEQLSLLQSGALDLGVLVMDENAVMVENAVRDRGLAIFSLPQAEAIARRLPRVRTGHIAAGQYDPVRMLPPTDKAVLQVDALMVGNQPSDWLTDDCPVAACDGHDFPRLIDQHVPGVAAVIDDIVEGFEDAIGQPVLSHELPDVFLGLSSGARGGSGRSDRLVGILRSLAPCQPA